MNEPDTPPPPASKEALSKTLCRDRRTITRAIEAAGILPAGHSPAGLPVYDLEAVREALDEREAAALPPMKPEQATASLIATLEFQGLMLDALAPMLPPATIRAAYEQAMQAREAGRAPEFLWALKVG
jgi:hypothetical protein